MDKYPTDVRTEEYPSVRAQTAIEIVIPPRFKQIFRLTVDIF